MDQLAILKIARSAAYRRQAAVERYGNKLDTELDLIQSLIRSKKIYCVDIEDMRPLDVDKGHTLQR